MTLKKVQIVNEIAQQNGFTKTQSDEIVETVLELIKKALEKQTDPFGEALGINGKVIQPYKSKHECFLYFSVIETKLTKKIFISTKLTSQW